MFATHHHEDKRLLKFFGKRLRAARRAANLSQTGLAQRLQVGQDTISNYEQGKVVPGILTLFQLAQILCVDVGYFFPDENFAALRDEDRETLAQLTSLTPIAYEFILTFVRYFIHARRRYSLVNGDANPQNYLIKFLERDVHALERILSAIDEPEYSDKQVHPVYALVGFTTILLMGIQLEKQDAESQALLQRLAANGNRLTLLVHELMRANRRVEA
jgi:transcriptional regulator with XRE-family HTH domain